MCRVTHLERWGTFSHVRRTASGTPNLGIPDTKLPVHKGIPGVIEATRARKQRARHFSWSSYTGILFCSRALSRHVTTGLWKSFTPCGGLHSFCRQIERYGSRKSSSNMIAIASSLQNLEKNYDTEAVDRRPSLSPVSAFLHLTVP